mmetsp:Transcript_11715/g.40476  ORF Transcript_11715/g.40476 Transcript_11715/m.40476 type:complete len:217 (-) Transcript_11715:2184-2834(-)
MSWISFLWTLTGADFSLAPLAVFNSCSCTYKIACSTGTLGTNFSISRTNSCWSRKSLLVPRSSPARSRCATSALTALDLERWEEREKEATSGANLSRSSIPTYPSLSLSILTKRSEMVCLRAWAMSLIILAASTALPPWSPRRWEEEDILKAPTDMEEMNWRRLSLPLLFTSRVLHMTSSSSTLIFTRACWIRLLNSWKPMKSCLANFLNTCSAPV